MPGDRLVTTSIGGVTEIFGFGKVTHYVDANSKKTDHFTEARTVGDQTVWMSKPGAAKYDEYARQPGVVVDSAECNLLGNGAAWLRNFFLADK